MLHNERMRISLISFCLNIRPQIIHIFYIIFYDTRGTYWTMWMIIKQFDFESKRKDTSLVITRSFQYFFEYRHQLSQL